MDPAQQWADRGLTLFTGLVLDHDGRLYGHPRGSAVADRELTSDSFATWARLELPAWQHGGMTPADWERVVDLLKGRVRARDEAALAATPLAARRAAEAAASRARAARRAELEHRAAEAAAELEALSGLPPEVEPTRRGGGWLRRPTPP